MELGGKDGSSLVHHALVATVVEIDKVFLKVARQGARINGVQVVMGGYLSLWSGMVLGGNVVRRVYVIEIDSGSA